MTTDHPPTLAELATAAIESAALRLNLSPEQLAGQLQGGVIAEMVIRLISTESYLRDPEGAELEAKKAGGGLMTSREALLTGVRRTLGKALGVQG